MIHKLWYLVIGLAVVVLAVSLGMQTPTARVVASPPQAPISTNTPTQNPDVAAEAQSPGTPAVQTSTAPVQNSNENRSTQTQTFGTGVQTIRMRVTPEEYDPSSFWVEAGRPIKFIVNGDQAEGCTQYIMSQKLGFSVRLQPGENVINIPALQKGVYSFSCSMNMVRGTINVDQST